MSSPKTPLLVDEVSCPTSQPSNTCEVPYYPDLVEFRSVIPGRGVFFNSQQHVYERLVSRGWENMCIIPTPCFPDLVRKFYAQAFIPVLATKTIFSQVNRCPVSFSVDDIAKFFNLRRESASEYPMPIEVLRRKLPLIVSALKGQQGYDILDLKYNDLTDEYRFLYKITIANLLPSTRSNDITVDLASFLYCVMSGSPLDLATIIWNEIADAIKSIGFSNSPLPYGTLISHILFRQHVTISYEEISSRPIVPIGSVKMIYKDMSECNSFGDIGTCLSLMSKDIRKDFDKVFSCLDRFDTLHNSHEALRSRVDTQAVVFKKLVNGGYLSYEEEEEIERTRADD